MIRIKIVAPTGSTHFAELAAIPLQEQGDFRCVPEGALSFDSAMQLSHQIQAGRIQGRIDGCRWYRQAGKE